jgi:AcrR family transcriptional regulator
MVNMQLAVESSRARKNLILEAAIPVFGRLGFKKTSVDDLADAADISKQGLYLHFSSKEEIFILAMQKYLEDGLLLVEQELNEPGLPLCRRLAAAMNAWFGRHLATFTPASFDVIEAGDRLSGTETEAYKAAFQSKLAKAIADSKEFTRSKNVCTPREIARVLFHFGLTWKREFPSRTAFMKEVGLCIKACCQIETR